MTDKPHHTLTMRRLVALLLITLAALACAFGLYIQHRNAAHTAALVRAAQPANDALPQRILWVWERPEDLHILNPATTGAAVYEGTLTLGDIPSFQPRRTPYILPQNTRSIAVVRIETAPLYATHKEDPAYLRHTVEPLLRVANSPGIVALQIDFDALKSDRVFYRSLLTRLRTSMPKTLPLTITALVSWCDEDDWISTLPINAATPMFFRMEPGRARFAQSQHLSAHLPEPLCNTSIGVSTHEPWPADIANRHIYLFPDKGWKQDLPLLPQLTASSTAVAPTESSSQLHGSEAVKPAIAIVSERQQQ